jgi:heat shock protein HslJ
MVPDMSKLFLLGIIFITILLVHCSSKETSKGPDIRLHDIWALESISGEKFVRDVETGNHPVIEIYLNEKRVHGNTGCNTLNSKVIIDRNHITFSELITTEMACPGDLERRFLDAIKQADNYEIKKLRLFLYEGEEERLIFRKID